jgi:NADH:ubiquinone oxidoreductase subunit 5 (subunit L)/multisubunit Na+/H+ antiporter MnhA subunit
MPITATLAMVAAAFMAGAPLLNGFLSKEMLFAETIEGGRKFEPARRRCFAAMARHPLP